MPLPLGLTAVRTHPGGILQTFKNGSNTTRRNEKMAREFIMPGRIVTGENALQLAESNLKELGKKALLVTDEVMVKLGNAAHVEESEKPGN